MTYPLYYFSSSSHIFSFAFIKRHGHEWLRQLEIGGHEKSGISFMLFLMILPPVTSSYFTWISKYEA